MSEAVDSNYPDLVAAINRYDALREIRDIFIKYKSQEVLPSDIEIFLTRLRTENRLKPQDEAETERIDNQILDALDIVAAWVSAPLKVW